VIGRLGSAFAVAGLLVLAALTSCAAATTARTAKINTKNLHLTSISFANTRYGWISARGSHGVLLKTTNGGSTWQKRKAPFAATQMQFISASTGWALWQKAGCASSCPQGLSKTTNGGKTWKREIKPKKCAALSSLDFISASEGWLVTSNEPCVQAGSTPTTSLMETSNGGTSWKSVFQPKLRLTSVHFGATSDGWALGDTSGDGGPCVTTIYATTNGGAGWTDQKEIQGYCSDSVDFVNSSDGWALVTNIGSCGMAGCLDNRLYRTTDGGANWKLEDKPKSGETAWSGPDGVLTVLHFVSPKIGYLPVKSGTSSGKGGIDITSNAGKTWARKKPDGRQVDDISPVTKKVAWAVGCTANSQKCSTVLMTSDRGKHWAVKRL
jgi:photosystem II stability/assembly factor-like uncharacterized protein